MAALDATSGAPTSWDPEPAGGADAFALLPDGSIYAGGSFAGFDLVPQANLARFPALPPAVTGLAPTSGPQAGGTLVTISGSELAGASSVTFGATPASTFTVNAAGTQIAAAAPPGSGTVDVRVTTPAGTSAVSPADQYTYVAAVAPAMPSAATGPPSVLSSSSAAFTALVNPDGLATTMHFEYGLDTAFLPPGTPFSYDQRTPEVPVGSDFTTHVLGASVTGLVPDALYRVRAVATNSQGTVYGSAQLFKTRKDPAPPAPVLGTKANFTPVSGIVFVLLPPGARALTKGAGFIPLTEARQLPVGTEVDARSGSLTITTATTRKHTTQSGTFGSGLFSVLQGRHQLGLTTLKLLESAFPGAPSYSACPRAGKASLRRAGGGASSHKLLQLLHASVHGRFQTRGQYSAATVRGTVWDTEDRCDGT
jgi:hypothetical protein